MSSEYIPNIKLLNGKEYIFCDWRRKYVRLTPEEWVRQHFLHRLEIEYQYPHLYIAVEVPLKNKRADAVVYKKNMSPLVLIEFKADRVPLDQNVLDQLSVYNLQLHVPFLFLSNGEDTMVAVIENKHIHFLDHIPQWKRLLTYPAII